MLCGLEHAFPEIDLVSLAGGMYFVLRALSLMKTVRRLSPPFGSGLVSCHPQPTGARMGQVSEELAASMVTRLFGKQVVSATRLDSYDDANFRISVAGGGTFTLKVP